MSAAYSLNEQDIVHDVIDGEAIMINLQSGNYYTLNDTGAFIWALLRQRRPVAEILRLTAAQFSQAENEMEAPLNDFFAHLAREGLICPTEQPPEAGEIPATKSATYAPPGLQVFSDMQDLLLLDPIHEIGDQGWPHAAPPQKKTA